MTDATMAQPKPPLGVGSIIGESFSILFSKFLQVVLIAFGPALIGLVLSGMLNGFGAVAGSAAPDFAGAGGGVAIFLTIIIQFIVYAVTTALLVQLAYDAKLGRPVQIGKYIGPAFSAVLPIIILGLASGILIMIGLALFIVPGLRIYAVFSVMAPAIVIERAGFGALGSQRFSNKGIPLAYRRRHPVDHLDLIHHQSGSRFDYRFALCRDRQRGNRHHLVSCPVDNRRRSRQYPDCPDLRPSARNQGRRQRRPDRVGLRLIQDAVAARTAARLRKN